MPLNCRSDILNSLFIQKVHHLVEVNYEEALSFHLDVSQSITAVYKNISMNVNQYNAADYKRQARLNYTWALFCTASQG